MTSSAQKTLGLLALLILLIAGMIFVGSQVSLGKTSELSCIVEDTRTGGGAGIERWARKLGFKTHPLRSPVWEVDKELPGTGHCLITAGDSHWNPLTDKEGREEWQTLRPWIQRGNSLIYLCRRTDAIPAPIRDHFLEVPENIVFPPYFNNKPDRAFSIEEQTLEDVSTWWGGRMAVDAQGTRLLRSPPDLVLAGTPDAAVLLQRPLGEGRIYLLLDGEAWTNAGFDRADNAATLARILQTQVGPEGTLAFDEYRHGRGRVESLTTFLFSLPGSVPLFWMALLSGLVWLWARNQRLGPAEEFREPERRTTREYIDAIAGMHQRARAAGLSVRAVRQRLEHLLSQRMQLPEQVKRLLRQADSHIALQGRPANPVEETQLVRELIRTRKELYGSRPIAKPDRPDA